MFDQSLRLPKEIGMKKIFIISLLFLMGMGRGIEACAFKIGLINSNDLSKERELFEKEDSLASFFPHGFDDQEAYIQTHIDNSLCINAIFMDQVIGYIFFDIGLDYHAYVRELVLDLAMLDSNLVKALILSIFDYVPQCSGISIQLTLSAESIDIIQVCKDIGFVRDHLTGMYELVVHDRCQICAVLYKEDFWETQDSDDDGDDFSATGEDWGAYDAHFIPTRKAEDDAGGIHPLE